MIAVQVPGLGLVEFPDGTPYSAIQAAISRRVHGPDTGAPPGQPTGERQDFSQKRAELARVAREGDLGTTDTSDTAHHGFWEFHGRSEMSPSEAYLTDTVADRGFGWVVGGLEGVSNHLEKAFGGGFMPEGTRAALRENQQESADRYLLAHPEGGVGRATVLALGDVGASMAGPQALLGPGAGGLAGKAALARGASPALARLAGFAGGALEGAGQSYLDSPDLTQAERGKAVGLGALMGGIGSMRGIELPAEDSLSAARKRAPSEPDVTQPRATPQLSEQELALYHQEKAAVPQQVAERMQAYEARGGKTITPEEVQAYATTLLKQVDQKWAGRLAELAAQEDSSKVRIAADDLAVKLAPEVKAPPRVIKAFGQEYEVSFQPQEAGFVSLTGGGPAQTAAPHPARPSDAVIAHDVTETTAPFTEKLKGFYNRFVEEFSDKEAGAGRMLRRHDLPSEAAHVDKLIAYNRAASAAAELPLFQGVERFDPKTGMRTRTYDPLAAILGGHDDAAIRDINDLMAAEHHMELVGRQERASLQYDMARARRLEEMRQARLADKTSLRAMSGDIRDRAAEQLRAERAQAKAGGRYDAFLTSENRARRAGSRRELLSPMEQSTDLAAGALGRGEQAVAAVPGPGGAITSAQRVAMGIRDEATRFRQRFPAVDRPADLDLNIDPEGTKAAQAIIADLHQRYGTDGAGRVAMFDSQGRNIPDRIREWSYHAVVQPLIDSGFLSEGQAAALMSKNERYAPFFRLMDEVSADGKLEVLSGSTNAKPIQRISGGLSPERPIAPPLESFIQQAQKVTVWARRQQIRNMLGDLAELHPDTVGKEVVKARGTGGPDSFPVYRDGRATHYQAPTDVMLALQRLTPKQAGMVSQVAQAAARFQRAGSTMAIGFSRNNFVKDQWSASVYGQQYRSVPLVDAVHGLLEIFRQGDAYRGYLSGGAMSELVSYGREATMRTLDDVRGKGGALGKYQRARAAEGNRITRLIYPILYPLETVSSLSERSTRVGAYRRAKLRGASDLDAAVFSRDITLDFGRSGTFGQRWNGYEAFFNANLQDVARFRKAMANPKTAFGTSVKALTYITLPALINHYANTPSDDVAAEYKQAQLDFNSGAPPDKLNQLMKDHPALHYAGLPEWEKVAFMHVGYREDGRPWRIPRPQGLLNLVFGYGVEKTLEGIKGSDPNAWQDIRNSFMQETPLRYLNPAEAMPSVLQPAVEAAFDYSAFKNGPVTPPSLNNVLPADRFTDQTTSIARWAGRLTNTAPVKIDYLIRGYLGTMGNLATQGGSAALDAGAKAMPGAAQAAGFTPSQLPSLPVQPDAIPGLGATLGSPSTGFGSKPVSDLYTVASVAKQAEKSYTNALDTGDTLNAARILREHPELMVLDALEDGTKQLSDLRKERQAVRHDTSLTPQQRMDRLMQIDLLVTQIAGARMIGVAEELWASAKR